MQPSTRLVRKQLEHGHHNRRSIGKAVARESEDHSGQHALTQYLTLGRNQVLDSLAHLGWIDIWFLVGPGKLGDQRLFKGETEQVAVVVKGCDKGVDLLQGEGAQGCGEDGNSQFRGDTLLGVEPNGIGGETEEILND